MKGILGAFLIAFGLEGLVVAHIKYDSVWLVVLFFVIFGIGLELWVDDKIETNNERSRDD